MHIVKYHKCDGSIIARLACTTRNDSFNTFEYTE